MIKKLDYINVMKPRTSNKMSKILFLILNFSSLLCSCQGYQSYSNATKIFEDKLGTNNGYNHAVRPLLDQTQVIRVNITFDIIALVEIDAIQQKFIVNGFLGLYWTDEILTWNYGDYGDTYLIHPYPKDVWRPRLVLGNTLEDRDLFEDDYCPMTVLYTGHVTWLPGSLFPTSCKLDLYKYPFDRQHCNIDMYSMGLGGLEIQFQAAAEDVSKLFYVESGEWKIENTKIVTGTTVLVAFFQIQFELRRLPGFFVINIILPIVLMSFLNILVFVIPVDSGEKISYGITVLLALTVFMSIVSDQLPRSSDTLPLVTVYLLVLTIISVCTVIVSIIIVYFHHREEKEVKRHKASSNFKGLFSKVQVMNRAASTFAKVRPAVSNNTVDSTDPEKNPADKTESVLNVMNKLKHNNMNNTTHSDHAKDKGDCDKKDAYVNRWRQIGKHLDFASFVAFTVIWVSVTIGFLVEMSR